MARPRVIKNQRTIDDLVIEDPELEDALAIVTETEAAAKAYREARHTVKTRIQVEHPEAINGMLETGRPRYNVCGNVRFAYQTAGRAAGSKPAPAGTTTRLEIYAMEDD